MSGDLLEVAEAALGAADGDEAVALVHGERAGLARFAGREVHQPTLLADVVVHVRVVRDGRVGTAATNRTGADNLAELARRAAAAADAAPADPGFAGLAAPAPMPEVEACDEETAALEPAEQAELAAAAMRGAGDCDVYGYFTSGLTEQAVASSSGVRASQRLTDATAMVIAAGDGFSGHAEATSWRVGALDPARVGTEAAEKAARTRGAVELEPGTYRAVLEPSAFGELLEYFAWDSFSGLALLEERSYLTGRMGEQVFHESVSISEDPLDARGLPKAFDFEGTPKRRVPLVEAGVATGAVWDRRSAARAGAESTGNASPPQYERYGPLTWALSVDGGDAAGVEELLERVGDGIYVTRLHYLSVVQPRVGIVTGMTRDGTFRVRAGKLAEPLVNLRFTASVPELLRDVLGLTRDVRLVNRDQFYDSRYPYGALVPALASGRFAISGTGSRPGL